MRSAALTVLTLLAAAAASVAPGGQLAAQGCARCKDCDTCELDRWGATECNFSGSDGDGNPCCMLAGEICNPAMFLAQTDVGVVGPVGETTLVSRLEGDVFGSWGCGDGSLQVAYRRDPEGGWSEVPEAEFVDYRERYPLTRYVEIAQRRLEERLARERATRERRDDPPPRGE